MNFINGYDHATPWPLLLGHAQADIEQRANRCDMNERIGQVANGKTAGLQVQ